MVKANSNGLDKAHLHYGMLHYHCRPGGVRTVMENTAISLVRYGGFNDIDLSFVGDVLSHKKYVGTFEIPDKSVVNIDINELNYSFKQYKSKEALLKDAKKLRDKLIGALPFIDVSKKNPYFFHVHNTNLGKSPMVSAAIYLLAEWAVNKPVVLIIQIHDFAENGRYGLLKNMQTCTGKFDNDFDAVIMYPNQKSVIYATINPGDMQNLIDIGIDKERIFLLPNSIDVKEFKQKALDDMNAKELKKLGIKKTNFSKEIKSRIKIFADKNGFDFDEKRSIILAPLKSMRRKNILESILLLDILNEMHKETHQLVVTLDAASGLDKEYSSKVKGFVKRKKLPVVIGIGDKIISPVPERVVKEGVIEFFNMDDMFELSEAVISTSLVEGFGFVFHEGWLTDKYVFGRKIPYVTNAFEENGMDFSHMYIRLNIDPKHVNLNRIKNLYFEKVNSLRKKESYKPLTREEFERQFKEKKMKDGFLDFGDLDVVAQINFLENFKKHKEHVIKINPHVKLSLNVNKSLIARNKKASEKNYSFKAKARRMLNLFKEGRRLVNINTQNKKVDNTKTIEKYIDLENLRLLI